MLDRSTSSAIEAELGGGRPLGSVPGARPAFAGERPDVRLHDDGVAAGLSRQLGALAFTFGRDIFLAGNAPDLGSDDGQAMLRHELTHVDQQARSGTTRPLRVSSPDSPAEQEATRAQHARTETVTAAHGTVARQEMPEEEEEAATMPAGTVARQEMPEEEEAVG